MRPFTGQVRFAAFHIALLATVILATAATSAFAQRKGGGTGTGGATGGAGVIGSGSAPGRRTSSNDLGDRDVPIDRTRSGRPRHLGTGATGGGDYDDLSTTRGASRSTSGRSVRRAGDFDAPTASSFVDESYEVRGYRPGYFNEPVDEYDDADFDTAHDPYSDSRGYDEVTGETYDRYRRVRPAVERAAGFYYDTDESVARRAAANADGRYRWHRGMWWYFTPGNTWTYWDNDRWNNYDARTFVPSLEDDARRAGRVNRTEDQFDDVQRSEMRRRDVDRPNTRVIDDENVDVRRGSTTRTRTQGTATDRDRFDRETINRPRNTTRSTRSDRDF